MAEPIRRRGQRRIALSVLALAAAVTTCRDAPSGPGGSRRGMVSIAPVFVGAMDPAAFGITIDSVRAVVIRPFIDTLADRTVAFPADSTALELDLPVLLHADVETLTVVLQYRGAGSVLFQGSRLVEVSAGPPGTAPPAEIPVLYIGPGAAVDSLVVTPADSIVSWGDSLRFQVAAFQGGLPVTQFYVSWTTTDTVNAPINGAGVLRAPNRRDTVFVVARTPGDSAVDSVAVTFMPLPSTITIVSGNNQSGSTGAPLAQALRVQVTAADGGGVALARVRYRVALGGGSVADTLVFTDDRGFAQTLATLGATVGAQAFEASFDASHFVRFDAAAIAGQAVRLEFTSQPVVTTAGIPVSPAVQVTARDSAGSVAAGFAGPVTVALLANPGGGTLLGTTTVNAIAGVASFSDLVLERASPGYTLLAMATNLSADTSAAFTVVAASVDAIQSTVSAAPDTITASTGASHSTITVTARDQFGNPIGGATVALAATGTGNTLTQPGTTNAAGTATGTLSSTVAAAQTVSAIINSVAITQTATITVVPAGVSAAQSTVSAAPDTITAGSGLSTITVTARDQFGNPIAGATVVLAATGTGNTLVQPGATNAAGVATGTLSSTVAAGKTVSATINGVAVTQAAAVTVNPAGVSAVQSTVSAAPDTITASTGTSLSTITVTARDQFNNPIGGATVVLAASGTGNVLTQPAGPTNASGVATGTLSSTAAAAKTVSATINGVAITQTGAVTVIPAGVSAAQSTVSAAPDTIAASTGTSQSTITVTARDQFANPIAGATVVLAATGTGNTLVQPGATNAAGLATGTLSSTVAAGKTVSATINGVAITQTAAVTVTPAAASQITLNAGDNQTATVSSTVAIAPSVLVRDQFNNPVPGHAVTFAVTAGGGSVAGGNATTNAAGIATVTSWTLGTTAGTNNNALQATSTGLTGSPVTFTASAAPAAASQLAFTLQPTTAVAGQAFVVQVTARDGFGNTATSFTGSVTLTLGANPGGSTFGSTSVSAVAGVATFGVSLDKTGTGYTLVAAAAGLTSATSAVFNVTPAAASQLVFTAQPAPSVAGVAISPPVLVTARDDFGNTATGFTGNVAIAIGTNPGGGTLSGTDTVVAVAGVATFATLSIDRAGTGYTLVATAASLTPDTSAAFDITPAAAGRLVFTVGPTDIAAGDTITPVVQVAAQDAFGNVATGFTDTVVVAIATNPPTDGSLFGTVRVAAAAGVASFSDLSIDLAGVGYTLEATAAGLMPDTSAVFTVSPGAISPVASMVSVSDSVVPVGGVVTLTLQARDQFGNVLTSGGDTVVFLNTGTGTSDGTIAPTPATDNGDGTYAATFTGTVAGTPTGIGATVNGALVATFRPPLRVFMAQTLHSTDITVDETWAAAGNPHVVTAYLRVRNGATLTIGDGAEVRFDAGAGLQIGDSTLATPEDGALVMTGTAGSILLTANTATPTPGFWKGIEVQRNIGTLPWKNVRFEWGGSPRLPMTPAPEACLLVVNNQGAQPVVLDSVTFNHCVHAAIHHFGGTLEVRRSTIDSAAGAGIHADFTARLLVDSSVFRGPGNEGLQIPGPQVELLSADGNQFLDHGVRPVSLFASQLPGLGRQAAIAGNGDDRILVHGGRADPSARVAAFTIFTQPAPYLVVDSLVKVGGSGAGGVTVTLDSGLVMQFGPQSGLVVGDSGTNLAGNIVSLGTNRLNAPRLTSAGPTVPGSWYGVEIGRLAANARLDNVRIEYAGQSIPGRNPVRVGLWARNSEPFSLDVDSVVLASNGQIGADSISAGFFASGAGAFVSVHRSLAESNVGYGFVTDQPGVRFVDDTARGNRIGLAVFFNDTPFTPADSLSGNVLTGNLYPLALNVAALPGLAANAVAGNQRDTLLLDGGRFTANDTLPKVPGMPWRVLGPIIIEGGGTLAIAAGDTVAFDDSTFIQVGLPGSGEGALYAVSTAAEPILLTASGLANRWFGIHFADLQYIEASPTTFDHVIIEKAGQVIQCVLEQGPRALQTEIGGCPISISGLRFTDSLDFAVFTNVTVRHAIGVALDILTPGPSTALVMTQSQFYANALSPMIRTLHPLALQLRQSDLYQYRGVAIQSGFGQLGDSVDATDNWWGDVAGPSEAAPFADSLGRASLNESPVRYRGLAAGFATTPHFPAGIGPAVVLAATTDTIVPTNDTVLSVLDFSYDAASADSLRVRALDAFGRGASGIDVSWQPLGPDAGTASPSGGPTDVGGRVATQWTAGTKADSMTIEAGGLGTVRFHALPRHGLTVPASVNWVVEPTLTGGLTNATLDTVTYTSTNRTSALITNARDAYGNVTHPSSNIYFFDEGPCAQFVCRYPAVDSIKHDTLFFRPPAVGTYVIKAFYDESVDISDFVALIVNAVPALVRIDRNSSLPDVQDTGLVAINALCPVVGPCTLGAAAREFGAFVVDSGLTPLGNAAARFAWIEPASPDTVITLDGTRVAPVNDTATVSAHQNGTSWLVVVDTTVGGPTSGQRDSVPIVVDQVASYALFDAPDSASVLVGDLATFTAKVYDAEGRRLPNDTVHFRAQPSAFGRGGISVTDTSVYNQVTVRMDSTPFGGVFVEGFFVRPLKDTLYGYSPGQTTSAFASVMNPVQKPIAVGGNPYSAAVNPATNRVYVTNAGALGVTVIDGASDAIVDTALAGVLSTFTAVNPKSNRVYVTQDTSTGSRIWAVDGSNNVAVGSLGLGVRAGPMAIDTARNRVYVAANKCFFDPQQITAFCQPTLGLLVLALDGTSLAVLDTVGDVAPGRGIAYNPVTDRIYVAVSNGTMDSVKVINPATFQVVGAVEVQPGANAVAVNPVTNKIYVTNAVDPGWVTVIDGATHTVSSAVFMGFSTFPQGLGVDPVRNLVYVSHTGVAVMRIIDGVTDLEVGQVNMSGVSTDAQPNPVTGRFYVTVYDKGVVRAMRY